MNTAQVENFNQLTKIRDLAIERVQYFNSGALRLKDLGTGKDISDEAIRRELHMIAGIEETISRFYSDLL